MKTLTSAANADKNATSSEPVTIVEIDFGTTTGKKYYSDRAVSVGDISAEARVTSWGPITRELNAGSRRKVQSCSFEMVDEDRTLLTLLEDNRTCMRRAVVYQHFSGNTASDLIELFSGIVGSPVVLEDDVRRIKVEIVDTGKLHSVTVGNMATRTEFPHISAADEGRCLPIVFGRVKRVPAVHALAGRKGVLLADCDDDDTTLYIAGFEDIEAGTSLNIRIGLEEIEGTIDGTTFTVTERGRSVASGTTTARATKNDQLTDTDITMSDNQYVGYFVKLWVPPYADGGSYAIRWHGGAIIVPPDGRYQYRYINRCDATNGKIYFSPYFTVEDTPSSSLTHYYATGDIYTVPDNKDYEIVTIATAHPAGAVVSEVLGGYTYILNDAPSSRVDAVYAYGRRSAGLRTRQERHYITINLGGGAAGQFDSEQVASGDVIFDEDSWIPLPPEMYTVNLNDTTTFTSLGRAVTTVSFHCNPSELPGYQLRDDRLLVDMHGVKDSSGELVENPSDVIREILEEFGGLDSSAEIDGASFTTAAGELSRLRFGFALRRAVRLDVLCARLAFQCASALLWREGKAALHVLKNAFDGTVPEIARSTEVEIDSVSREETGAPEVVTEIEAVFAKDEADDGRAELTVSDSSAEARWGRRTKRIDLTAFNRRDYALRVARFWLERWKGPWRRASFRTYLNRVELEPGDVVELNFPGILPSGQRGEIQTVTHLPGSGVDGRPDGIDFLLALPAWAECTTTCEVSCETGCETGCEIGCESTCETGCELTCESTCQNYCELSCDSAAEAGTTYCSTSCTIGCEVMITGGTNWGECSSCETTCEAICESGSCETSCQLECELDCQTGCEVSCETTCELTCEISCETGCETSCETGCETSCETDCEVVCETACEQTCETGCETSSI